MYRKKILFKYPFLFIFWLLLSIGNIFAQELAFPGAQGWAAYTPGGRRGEIIRVTNLNSSGSGSFAQAATREEKRIIVFEVGGVVDLKGSEIIINEPYLTIAGQTAPSPGITFVNGAIYIKTHDVIVQHIHIRPGAEGHSEGWEPDAISTLQGSNVIIDHCSFTWAVDENCSVSGPRFEGETPDEWRNNTSHKVTISNNIIAEALSNSTHKKGEHSKGTLIHENVTETAVLNNLYSCNLQRNPFFKGGTRGVVVNNIIYNPGGHAVRYLIMPNEWEGREYQKGKITLLNNILKYGPNTEKPALLTVGTGPCEVFMEGNVAKNMHGENVPCYHGDNSKLVKTKPIWHETINPVKTNSLKENIIRNVGARPWDRDNIDNRIINDMVIGKGKIIDSELEVGGLPAIHPTAAKFKEGEWDLNFMIKVSPKINISKPANGSFFPIGTVIPTELNTIGYNEKIESVELFANGISVGKDLLMPFRWDFDQQVPGEYSLVAIVKNYNGNYSATHPIQIKVYDKSVSCPSVSWVDSIDTYARESFMPAIEYHWEWGQATMLRAMVNQYDNKSETEKLTYLNYIRTAMDSTYKVANGKHPNAVASGHGMAFLARITGEKKYYEKAIEIYEDYLTTPRVLNGGVSHRIETEELWDDTIYMLSMFFLEMFRLTSDEKYIAELANQFKAHREKLEDKHWGLWVHGWDNDSIDYDDGCSIIGWPDKITRRSHQIWGRGNGWLAMALADAMRIVPRESVYWSQFEEAFKDFTKKLPQLQDQSTGHWFQLPIYPNEPRNYQESSCTAMFAYGLAVALRLNVIDESTFRPVINKAYKGLREYSIKKSGERYLIPTQVCMGTCIGDKNYYLNRRKVEGTNFGIGAFIMFGLEYDKLYKKELN